MQLLRAKYSPYFLPKSDRRIFEPLPRFRCSLKGKRVQGVVDEGWVMIRWTQKEQKFFMRVLVMPNSHRTFRKQAGFCICILFSLVLLSYTPAISQPINPDGYCLR